MRRLTAGAARRIALAAQGFAGPKPRASVNAGHIRRMINRIGMLQLDSVNVLVRSHYLPLFSRLGPYPVSLLDEYAYKRRRMFEYWGHAASLIPVERYPLFRHRMERRVHWGLQDWADEHPQYVEAVLAEVTENGPIAVGELPEPGQRTGSWWGWGEGKLALEYLFARGLITTAARQGFTRLYDTPERVLPARYLDGPPINKADAHREMLLLAARHLGIGTARDIADYYRHPVPESKAVLRELAEAGALHPVEVKGWREVGYLHPEARIPRRVNARALLSPFDSLVWERARTERIFGFRYRIEIYTPRPKRIYGYYVLPFLLGEELVGRVDLSSDRKGGRLLVHAAHAEEGADHEAVAGPLAEELRSMALWLGLETVALGEGGDLTPALAAALNK